MSYSGGTSNGSARDGDGNGGIQVRGEGRSQINVAGRDINTIYFVSASSAALAALVGLVILLSMWQPWQEAAPTDERDRTNTGLVSTPSYTSFTKPKHYQQPPPAGEDDKESEDQETSPSPSPSPTPTPPPDPPDPDDVAFASVGVGTCLNVYDIGWGKLSQDRPVAVDCGANFAFSKVTMVTPSASNCPQGAGRRSWGHVNDDGSSLALCLDRMFAAGQCFPATLSRQADGSLHGEARLFSVWGCDRTQVPSGQNAIMAITAVVHGGSCPQRNDRQTLSWQIYNGSGKVCAVQRRN